MRFNFFRGQNIEIDLIDSTEKEKENEIKNKMKKIDIKNISRYTNKNKTRKAKSTLIILPYLDIILSV